MTEAEKSDYWDRVLVYLPVTPLTTPPSFKEEQYLFPLAEVFSLVWRATHDATMFVHHYKDSEESLQHAENDLPNRLITLVRCLQAIQKGICHQGIRNEIVLSLNHVYKGIDIIEDDVAAVFSFVRDYLNVAFFKRYESPETSPEQKKELFRALALWMRDSDASEVIYTLNLQQPMNTALGELFIEHGINPDTLLFSNLHLVEYVDSVVMNIEFTCDIKSHPRLMPIQFLLTADSNVGDYPVRNTALSRFKDWIQNTYELDNPRHQSHLTTFYLHYLVHSRLVKHQLVLTLTGCLEEQEIQTLLGQCETYFQTDSSENDYPLEPLRLVLIKINASQNDNLVAPIENFFTSWFEAEKVTDLPSLCSLYAMLVNKSMCSKIVLDDTTLKMLINRFRSSEGANDFVSFGPYEVNRLFLSAIITHQRDWTELFAEMFHATLMFVKNGFNQETDTQEMATALKRDSYPPQLMDQLEYLYREYHRLQQPPAQEEEELQVPQDRPKQMILLPNQVQTFDEWQQMFKLIDSRTFAIYYDHSRVQIDKLIQEFAQDELSKALFQAVNKDQLLFVKHLCNLQRTKRPQSNDVSHALYLAADRSSWPIVEFLCNLNGDNKPFRTAITNALSAAHKHGQRAIIQSVCSNATSVALSVAKSYNLWSVVKFLCSLKGDYQPTVEAISGALDEASKENEQPIVEFILNLLGINRPTEESVSDPFVAWLLPLLDVPSLDGSNDYQSNGSPSSITEALTEAVETCAWPVVEFLCGLPNYTLGGEVITDVLRKANEDRCWTTAGYLCSLTGDNRPNNAVMSQSLSLVIEHGHALFEFFDSLIGNNQIDAYRPMLESLSEIYRQNYYGSYSPSPSFSGFLEKATRNEDWALVDFLCNMEVLSQSQSLLNAFTAAARYGQLSIVELIVKLRRHNDIDDKTSSQALHFAVMNEEPLVVEFLCKTFDYSSEAVSKALYLAARYGHESIVRFFCNLQDDNKPDAEALSFALTNAVLHGQQSVVEFLYHFENLYPSDLMERAQTVDERLHHLAKETRLNQYILSKSLIKAAYYNDLSIVKIICNLTGKIQPTAKAVAESLTEAAGCQDGQDIVKYLCTLSGDNRPKKDELSKALSKAISCYKYSTAGFLCSLTEENRPYLKTMLFAFNSVVEQNNDSIVEFFSGLTGLQPDNRCFRLISDYLRTPTKELTEQTASEVSNIAYGAGELSIVQFIATLMSSIRQRDDVMVKFLGLADGYQDHRFLLSKFNDLRTSSRVFTGEIAYEVLRTVIRNREWPIVQRIATVMGNIDPMKEAVSKALTDATKSEQWSLVEFICNSTKNIKPDTDALSNALIAAANDNQKPIVEFICSLYGSETVSKALFLASKEGSLHAIRFFFSLTSEMQPTAEAVTESLTEVVVNKNRLDIIKYLCNLSRDKRPKKDELSNALSKAISSYKYSMAGFLCSLPEDNRPYSHTMLSAFDSAFKQGHDSMVDFLCGLTDSVSQREYDFCRFISNLLRSSSREFTGQTASEVLKEAISRSKWPIVRFINAIANLIGNIQPITEAVFEALAEAVKRRQWFKVSHICYFTKNINPGPDVVSDALIAAAEHGQRNLVDGICPSYRSEGMSKALYLSSRDGRLSIVKFFCDLEKNKPDPDAVSDALVVAAEYGQQSMVEFICSLLERNQPLKWAISKGLTMAACNGHLEIVKFLCNLKKGNHPNEKAVADALSVVVDNHQWAIVEFLCQLKNATRPKTEAVSYALNGAAKGGVWHIVKLLCDFTAEYRPNAESICNALSAASEVGNQLMVEQMCNISGNKPNQRAVSRALSVAASKGHQHIVEYFFHLEGDNRPGTKELSQALSAAARHNQLSNVKEMCPEPFIGPLTKLATKLLNKEARSKALICAAKYGHAEIVSHFKKDQSRLNRTAVSDARSEFGIFRIPKNIEELTLAPPMNFTI